jgi:hypothetical protein
MSWSLKFHDPIIIKGRKLRTLRDAAVYITKLPDREQKLSHWQDAAEALMLVAKERDGPAMFARIGMMKALNFGVDQKPAPRVKRAKAYRIIP